MELPFGELKENKLVMHFSTADYSIASVISAIRERLDLLAQLEVVFQGAQTELTAGPAPVFIPVPIAAHFIYKGKGDAKNILIKVYEVVWEGLAYTFPDEASWATAKSSYADFIEAQAQLLHARIEATSE
ncbi:MAG: hypothetical protein A2Y62_19445 [Candidatus Fischerbacteria bacterium RBG_13_37_8]|uniref:Uncharacterized protein n=1 Tax=Candidatus Fischerbacteria bacterium RBG_13_37_8 TaxID=1817863 RepID=A0A1F5VN29_9BACT|nr:MAG: hypothetical protein A2Y62_19445 [Candidatus Fischerbacteria bacterium RBG_13_37_8]